MLNPPDNSSLRETHRAKVLRDEALGLCRERFGTRPPGLDRLRLVKEPEQLARLLGYLGSAKTLEDALASLSSP